MNKLFSVLLLASALIVSRFSLALEIPETASPETESPTSNYKTDFTEINNFSTALDAPYRPCTPKEENSKNPQTHQNCKILNWGKAQYERFNETPNCQKFFFNPNGQVGELSKYISKMIAKDIQEKGQGSSFMEEPSQLGKVMPLVDKEGQVVEAPLCPGFKNFTPQSKVAFYTWVFELTAFAESSCDPDTKANADPDVPNGPAVGLYQLELKRDIRGWRGGACKTLDEEQILTAEGNTACAFQIFRSFLEKKDVPFGEYDEKLKKVVPFSYWHSHNPIKLADFKSSYTNYMSCKETYPKTYKAKCKLDPRAKFFGRLPSFPLCQNALPNQ